MLDAKTCFWSLGTFLALSFVLCLAWGLLTPEALHMHQFLEIVLPGFTWLTIGGFFLGLIESFAWGAYIDLVFVPIHNYFHERWN